MNFYRNALIAAACIPAAIISIPFANGGNRSPTILEISKPGYNITNYKGMPSEDRYRKLIRETEAPTQVPTPLPTPTSLKDYELAISEALNIKGAAPLMAVEGYDPSRLLEAIMETESRRNHYEAPGVVKRGGSGEVGIMQILPSTGNAACDMSVEELMSMDNNVECGTLYFSDALVTCQGSVIGALTNYNRGSSGNCQPGDYSQKVLQNYDVLRD